MNIFNELLYCKSNRIAVLAGVGSGKTTAALNYAMYYANKNPSSSVYIKVGCTCQIDAIVNMMNMILPSMNIRVGTGLEGAVDANCLIVDDAGQDVDIWEFSEWFDDYDTIVMLSSVYASAEFIKFGFENESIVVSTFDATQLDGTSMFNDDEFESVKSEFGIKLAAEMFL